MYISRGIDSIQEYNDDYRIFKKSGKNTLGRRILRKILLKKQTKLIVSERIIETPLAWQKIFEQSIDSYILEVGCYGSEFPTSMSALGYKNIYGVDIRKYPLEVPSFHFFNIDAAQMSKFNNDTFDLVLCISVLEHIGLEVYGGERKSFKDKSVVDEILRVLKPGKKLFLTIPFGKEMSTSWYRTYNLKSLSVLFPKDFQIGCYRKKERYGCWSKVDPKVAEKIEYSAPDKIYPTDCVACVEYKK